MFKHYLKIAFRNMWKYKTQSFTGIFGLAFALACFVPALYWMRYETSYDCFYPDAEHIYRIYTAEKQSGKVNKVASRIVEKKVREQFPAVEASTAYITGQENCHTEELPHIRMNMLYADSTLFSIFPQTIVYGDTKQPLQVMNNMVLTETMAVRLFGDVEKAIGRQVQTKIKASVVKDPPPNSNLLFDAIIVHNMLQFFSDMPEEAQWKQFFMEVHVKINPGADTNEMADQLRELTTRLGTNPDIELRMMPVSDVRHQLNSDAPFTLNFIGLFVASGVLLLFTAIFNFLNLHIDLFRQRMRELRLRTIHGATGGQLSLTPVSALYDRLNQSEQVGLKMFSVLSTVCLLISLFSIYAVAATATRRRRKEIAIRKVVGAKAGTIVRMFFREYTLQVILAGALALPLAYLTMSNWLQGYAYRTNIPGWLLAGVLWGVVAVVLLTVLRIIYRIINADYSVYSLVRRSLSAQLYQREHVHPS